MKLKEYLTIRQMPVTEFAALLHLSTATIHNYLTGRRIPPLRVALRIQAITRNKVTVKDWGNNETFN